MYGGSVARRMDTHRKHRFRAKSSMISRVARGFDSRTRKSDADILHVVIAEREADNGAGDTSGTVSERQAPWPSA
jgi:hypothetical protein